MALPRALGSLAHGRRQHQEPRLTDELGPRPLGPGLCAQESLLPSLSLRLPHKPSTAWGGGRPCEAGAPGPGRHRAALDTGGPGCRELACQVGMAWPEGPTRPQD